jgi:hypothetical protein
MDGEGGVKEEEHKGFYGWLERVFEPIDSWLGPSRLKHKPACTEDKDLFLDCVMKSECFA